MIWKIQILKKVILRLPRQYESMTFYVFSYQLYLNCNTYKLFGFFFQARKIFQKKNLVQGKSEKNISEVDVNR